MLQTPNSSPRLGGNADRIAGPVLEDDAGGIPSQNAKKGESFSGRNGTPRNISFQTQFHRQRPPPRIYKSVVDQPYYLSPFIQDHGRWESTESLMPAYGTPVRLGPPRRIDKEDIDLQALPVLKQPNRNLNESGVPPVDCVPEEKYRAQLRTFSQLPAQAHEKIRELGNEIVACYGVQLCKFFNDSLVETTAQSFAVFTKKSRTGQRWLMVFRHDRGRVSVKYNKLLTNQLLVRSLNPVSVEVESARTMGNAPQETCVFTFNGPSEAGKFRQDIQESQSIAWNHREVLLEQSLRNPDQFLGYPANFPHYSPRPLSARCPSSSYIIPPADIAPLLTPRSMKVLPPVVPNSRPKRSPFTVSARTPRADLDENWRNRESLAAQALEKEFTNTPTSVTQSPIRKRSKGSSGDSPTKGGGGGDGDFVYNSLTHTMALQQHVVKNMTATTENPVPAEESTISAKDVGNKGNSFQVSEVLVSNKRDVGTGAPDEEFFSLGSGQVQVLDNGEEQFDEVKCYASEGQLMFSQILYGWNKVRTAEGCQNPKTRWWIGAAAIGVGGGQSGETARIREFKATFVDEDSAVKFAELFQEGAKKGNNPEVRQKYLAKSLRI